MESNGQHFDKCQPIEGDTVGVMQMRGRQVHVCTHPPVDVDTEHGQLFTAIGTAGTTGTTPAALEVRPNGDIITDGDRLHTCSKRMHGHGKLVAQHTWVPKKRLTTCVRVQVGSTNAHSAHPYLDPSRRWCIRHGDITQPQICDIVEADLEHAGLFSTGVGVGG
jgi:hypothetical protein